MSVIANVCCYDTQIIIVFSVTYVGKRASLVNNTQ